MTDEPSTATSARFPWAATLPFTVIDEAVHALDSPREP